MSALDDVLLERAKQDKKWGEQNHNPYIYLAILVEEVGELAQAILHTQFGGSHGGWSEVRKEAVHLTAVGLAIIECLDRNKWEIDDVEFIYPVGGGRPKFDHHRRYFLPSGRLFCPDCQEFINVPLETNPEETK